MTTTDHDTVRLVVDILDYWLPGTGQAAGTHFDETADRECGLPYLGGKHLKGLLRNAVQCAEHWGQAPKGSAIRFFGQPEAGEPACLRVDNARLPEAVRRQCLADPTTTCAAFFREISSTAMAETGTAKPRSLRNIEVVVPLRLEALITCVAPTADTEWQHILARCAPLIRAVGKGRNRGLGRAELSIQGLGAGSSLEADG